MKLKFKRQQYQEDAAMAVVKCFEGQPYGDRRDLVDRIIKSQIGEGGLYEEVEEDVISFGNKKIIISSEQQRKNINKVQNDNRIDLTPGEGLKNYSIEMETGTGKTYTYIKTMFELNKAYGWSKFIIIVPSVAIREGVNKSFEITTDDFQEKYGKKIRYFVYGQNPSNDVTNIKSYAEDSGINVIIMNYQAFNSKSKDNKRIYDETLDETGSRSPISIIKATNPILIIDEPQKMGKTETLLDEFNPLFILRYSATHKDKFKYNMVYRLDAVDAYNHKLVKKINVKGIEIKNDKSEGAYVYLQSVEISKGEPEAYIEIDIKTSNGTKRIIKKVRKNSNLYDLSDNLEEYKDRWIVENIDATNPGYDKITFLNGVEVKTGQVIGNAEDSLMARIQIRETIKSHFNKERELYHKGIKVLSLFFIDEVAKYKYYKEGEKHSYKGEYAKIFEEEYTNILNDFYTIDDPSYRAYLDSLKDKKVDSGYFSIDKKKGKNLDDNEEYFVDSKIDDKDDSTSSDQEAYDLIMRDKERLLSLDEPVRFIFSHSALREGWDNPNIFQICTLRNTHTYISRRQEVGRGLRICVNNNGERMDYSELEDDFFKINNLTIVTSGSYEEFAKGLQKEISDSLQRKAYDTLTQDLFKKIELKSNDGQSVMPIDNPTYNKYFDKHFYKNEYTDDEGKITTKLKEDLANGTLILPEGLEAYSDSYIKIVESLFTDKYVPIENDNKTNITSLETNSKFTSKEFQELWNKINVKTTYTVEFKSEELIKDAIEKLNKELVISKMKYTVIEGDTTDSMNQEELRSGTAMKKISEENQVYEGYVESSIKYDLVGSVASETGLTRKTIIKILSGIEKAIFNQYSYNPEEFIRKSSNLINEAKATTIVAGITYKPTGKKFENDIFTINSINGKLGENALKVNKSIYEYLISDSDNERKFAARLEAGKDVVVYAKLPNKFKIPTPMGNYNPDWAIVFNEGIYKYIYFIAETKGSMSSLQLRGSEKAKIECARKHFEKIINDNTVKYDVVKGYDELIDLLTQITE